jgi:hypothetical protein
VRARGWGVSAPRPPPLRGVASFFLVGISATGEREQFTLIAVAPYVFLCGARVGCRRVPLCLAVAIGAWSGLGLCLKPFFVVVPLALQGWLYWQTRRLFPESAAIAAVGALYLLAIALIDPDYVAVLRMAGHYYSTYNIGPLTMLLSSVVAVAIFAFIGLLMAKTNDEAAAIAIAAFAFLAAYLMQAKGFRYQSLPAVGLFSLMAMLNLRWKAKQTIPMAIALVLAFATSTQQTSQRDPDAERAVADLKPNASVLIVTAYSQPAWPMVEERGLRWSSPFMFYWMSRNPGVTTAFANADVRRRPDRILVDDRLGVTLDLSGYQQGRPFGHFATFTRR